MTETTQERRKTTGVWLRGLRRERLNAGLSLKDLEDRTAERGQKVYKATISETERLIHGAYPRTAYSLAQALGIKVEELTRE